MSEMISAALQMNGAALAQQIGTAVARQQIAADRSVADMVAQGVQSAAPPAPAGQGQRVDIRV